MVRDGLGSFPMLLGTSTAADVVTDPFPHLIVENALDADVYRELESHLPSLDLLKPEDRILNNTRVDLISSSGRAELPLEAANPQWREFLDLHASEAFVKRVMSIFGAHLPQVSKKMHQTWSGFRAMNDFRRPENLEIRGRATLALNTPVQEPTSVRGPHVDSRHKCFVGLYYSRHPEDRSEGGDLELYRWKKGVKKRKWAGQIAVDDVDIVTTVPYQSNTLVIFLNTDDAVHGVSPRGKSTVPRYLSVLSGWLPSAPERAFGEGFTDAGAGVYRP